MNYEEIFDKEYLEFAHGPIGTAIAVDNGMLVDAVAKWGKEKGLNDPKAQLNKVIEEIGEVAHEITRNKYKDNKDLTDAFGDVFVTIIILADMLGYDLFMCLEAAYKEIAHRTGKTELGTFIKEE